MPPPADARPPAAGRPPPGADGRGGRDPPGRPPLPGAGGRGGPGSAADADELLVDELVDAVAAELAAEAGALDAAERQLGAVGADEVDEDHPGLDPVGDPERLVGVG